MRAAGILSSATFASRLAVRAGRFVSPRRRSRARLRGCCSTATVGCCGWGMTRSRCRTRVAPRWCCGTGRSGSVASPR
ncbi:hypothetical protein ACFPRL_27045 [Pseudoclavibacter helvolus]